MVHGDPVRYDFWICDVLPVFCNKLFVDFNMNKIRYDEIFCATYTNMVEMSSGTMLVRIIAQNAAAAAAYAAVIEMCFPSIDQQMLNCH